jgi:hypothetical protein
MLTKHLTQGVAFMALVRTSATQKPIKPVAIEIPVELQILLLRLKTLWAPLKSPKPFTCKKDLDPLTSKLGIEHRLKNQNLYEENATRILDYFVINFIDDFANIFTHADDLLKAVKDIVQKLKSEGIIEVENYFDNLNGAAHVYGKTDVSTNLYIKIYIFKEFLLRFKAFAEKAVAENVKDKNLGITPLAKAAVDVFVLGDVGNAQAKNELYKNSKIVWGYVKMFGARERLSGMIKHLAIYNTDQAHKEIAAAKFKEYLQINFQTEDSRVFSLLGDKAEELSKSAKQVSVSSHHATLYGTPPLCPVRKDSGSQNEMKAESLELMGSLSSSVQDDDPFGELLARADSASKRI